MRRLLPCLALVLALPARLGAQAAPGTTTLEEAIAVAQRRGPDARAADAARDRALLANRAFRARLLPQVGLAGVAPDYTRGINPVTAPDGTVLFVPQGFTQSNVGVRVAQQVPALGAELYVRSGLQRLDVIGNEVRSGTRTWNTAPFAVGLRQELFRPRRVVWESRRQALDAELGERRWLEAREQAAETAVERYFDAWAATVAARNAAANAAVNDTLYTLNRGRFEVGRIGENDLLQSELALLRARAALDGARLEEERALAALRIVLDLAPGAPLAVVPPGVLAAAVRPDTAVAVAHALRSRARLVELERDRLEARRGLASARLLNGFNAVVTAEVGYNQSASQLDSAYRQLRNQQAARVEVDVPLWQWGAGRNEVAAAEAERERVDHVSRRARREVEQEAHFAALQFSQSERSLAIAAKADTVAAKRFEVARQRYVIGRIGVTDLYLAQTEKDAALDAYVRALRGYWRDWYRLRRLTLYDFAAGAPIAP